MKRIRHYKLMLWMLIVSLLCGTCVQAETIVRADVPFQQMKYERVEKTEVDKLLKEGEKIIKANNMKELEQWQLKYYELYNKVMANSQLAYLYYELDNSDSHYYKEYIYCLDLIGDMKAKYIELLKIKETSSSTMKQYYALSIERQNLVDKYSTLQLKTTIKYDDREMTLTDLAANDKLSSQKKYELAIGKWYDTYNEQAANIFIKLIKLDKEMAKLAGFDSVQAYMYEQYGRDYKIEKSNELIKNVKKYVPDVYKKLYNQSQNQILKLMSYTYSNEDALFDAIDENFVSKYPKLKEAYDYLRKYGLYDIKPSSRKSTGGFTTYLSGYEEPFISLNYSGDYMTAMSLIHEFGHFNFEYTTGNYPVSLDLGETYSQGMEMLAFPYHDQIMGSKELGDAIRSGVILNMLKAIMDGCIYEEFMEKAYQQENLTPEKLNELYGQVVSQYGIEQDNRQWVEITHNFETPFYYFSYSVSAMAALQIWQQTVSNYDKAMKIYMQLIEAGTQYNFQEALSKSGLKDPFQELTTKNVMQAITDEFITKKEETTQQKKAA